MFKLVYNSRATSELGQDEVHAIVEHAQRKNAERGITGFLCLHQGGFLQYLEGEESAVRELLGKLYDDSRHEILRTVELGHQEERNFSSWHMRYLDEYSLGQMAIEKQLEGILVEFGRGGVEDSRATAMAERLVGRIAELRSN